MKPILFAMLGIFLATHASAENSLVVIANPSVQVEQIDANQATQIFLRQVQSWPDGTPIQPVDIKEGSPLRAEFYSKVTGRSLGQLRAYWARQAFTGMGVPPRQVSAEEMNRVVEVTPGAIGYTSRDALPPSTKVVLEPAR